MAKKSRSAAQRRATAKLVAFNKARRGGRKARRKSNPVQSRAARRGPAQRSNPVAAARRSNPVAAARRSNPVATVRRRRRNPISLGGGLTMRGMLNQAKDALIGAGGAVAVDMVYARINPLLPAALQKTATVGAGDAVKAVVTALLGRLLSKPTRGMSNRMAMGALTVQAHGIVTRLLPAGMLGYYSPARIVQGTNRVGPNMAALNGLRAYLPPGTRGPMLNAYTRPGATQLLSNGAREREGVIVR